MNIAPRQPAPPTGPRGDDPRLGWSRTGESGTRDAAESRQGADSGPAPGRETHPYAAVPVLRHRRDGILPAVAGALSVRGVTWKATGSKADGPGELHPLIGDFLAALPVEHRERHTGRCPEALLLSRFLASAEESRSGRKAGRAFSDGEARKALKQARFTARHVREDGDPEHGAYAPPCRSCARLLDHFGVTAVGPEADAEAGEDG